MRCGSPRLNQPTSCRLKTSFGEQLVCQVGHCRWLKVGWTRSVELSRTPRADGCNDQGPTTARRSSRGTGEHACGDMRIGDKQAGHAFPGLQRRVARMARNSFSLAADVRGRVQAGKVDTFPLPPTIGQQFPSKAPSILGRSIYSASRSVDCVSTTSMGARRGGMSLSSGVTGSFSGTVVDPWG